MVAAMRVGTTEWAERTGGRLRRRDQLDQTWKAVRAQVRIRLGKGGGERVEAHVEVAESPPDSAFARAALECCRDLSSEALTAHCLRTWLLGDLIAQVEGLEHDPELFFAATALHDLGLTEAHWCAGSECFAVDGARAAAELADREGYPKAASLAEAISLHLNVEVPVEMGAEAHLLAAGAACDVVGARASELSASARAEVVRMHPRDGFAAELTETIERQATARPRSRIGLLWRLGFKGFIARGDRVF
jgi:HD domain